MLVSRTWCLSAFPLLYARPNITSASQLASLCRVLNTPASALSLPYHTQIRRMNFNLINKDLSSELFVPLRVCTRMERITMVGCSRVSAAALRTVIDAMPELVAVDMANSDSVDDSVLKILGRRCPRLQGLNLSGCKSVGDEGVRAIARGCRMLRRVSSASLSVAWRIADDLDENSRLPSHNGRLNHPPCPSLPPYPRVGHSLSSTIKRYIPLRDLAQLHPSARAEGLPECELHLGRYSGSAADVS